MEELLKRGFHYSVELKIRNGKEVKDLRVFYVGIEIYHHILHISISADIIFINICTEYKNNFMI